MSWRLFDTSVFVDYLRDRQPGSMFVASVHGDQRTGSCSVITVAELLAGTRIPQERRRIEQLLRRFLVYDLTREIAELAGLMLAGRSSQETRAHLGDALIAATAIVHQETVLTADAASGRTFGALVQYDVYDTAPP